MVPFRAEVILSPFECRVSGLAFLYVVETGWGENIALLATISAEEGELSAVPGDTPTSFLTDSRAMANDSLDCHHHRYDGHYNHQQGSNYGT